MQTKGNGIFTIFHEISTIFQQENIIIIKTMEKINSTKIPQTQRNFQKLNNN